MLRTSILEKAARATGPVHDRTVSICLSGMLAKAIRFLPRQEARALRYMLAVTRGKVSNSAPRTQTAKEELLDTLGCGPSLRSKTPQTELPSLFDSVSSSRRAGPQRKVTGSSVAYRRNFEVLDKKAKPMAARSKKRGAPAKSEVVPLAGRPTRVERIDIPLNLLDLDPENPRIGMAADSKPGGGLLSQPEAEFALKSNAPDEYEKLKLSVEANKGLVEPIWVLPSKGERYRVIEGNTRVLIYGDLQQKYHGDPTYSNIPARILPPGVDSRVVHFIRVEAHLRGVTPWDAYERARYLWRLFDVEGYPIATLATMTRLEPREIQVAIDGYRTMTEHYLPRYPDPGEVLKFSYFVEYHSKSRIRDAISRNGFTVDDLCTWIGDRKLRRARDIRDLPEVLDTKEAREEFVKKGFEDAWDVLQYARPTRASPLFSHIGHVIEGLKDIPAYEITEIQSRQGEQKRAWLHLLRATLDEVMPLVEPRKRGRK